MMQAKMKPYEFFSLLFLSVMMGIFMFTSGPDTTVSSADSLLQVGSFLVLNSIFALPTLYYCQKSESGILRFTEEFSPSLSKICGFLYFSAFLFGCVRTVSRFDLFVSSELFAEKDMTVFLLGVVAVCAALSSLGICALARSGVVFSLAVAVGALLVLITAVPEFDKLNFTPPFQTVYSEFFKNGMLFSSYAVVVGLPVLFRGEIKGNLKKPYFLWLLSTASVIFVVILTVIGSLGSFADDQLFPAFAISSIGQLSLFERLDALETAVWIFCVIAKITFYISICVKGLCSLFPKRNPKIFPWVTAFIIGAFEIFISPRVSRFEFLASFFQIFLSYGVVVILLPAIGCVCLFIKEKRKRDE